MNELVLEPGKIAGFEPENIREGIVKVQEFLLKQPGVVEGDQPACPLKHTFADGIYVREIFIPKGHLVVGKIHKHSHPNFLMSGEVSVITETEGSQRLKGPLSMISKPGTKRLLFAHTDLVWITVHNVGEERNLEKIEDIVIAKSYGELAAVESNKPSKIEQKEEL